MSQYFDNDKNIKSEKRLIKFNFNAKEFSMYSDNGVFSKDKFDYGTRVLLENIDIHSLCGKVLDLGCGTGVVGLILGTFNKNISIDMIDVNERAIELASENIKLNNFDNNIFVSNVFKPYCNNSVISLFLIVGEEFPMLTAINLSLFFEIVAVKQ